MQRLSSAMQIKCNFFLFLHDDQSTSSVSPFTEANQFRIIYLDKPVNEDSPHFLVDVELMSHVIWRNTATILHDCLENQLWMI